MRQTEHYELNQWDPTDRILREDFNSDNLKIAAALAGKLDRAELLESQKFAGPDMANIIFFDLKNRHWESWEFICFHVTFFESTLPKGNDIKVAFNDGSEVLGTFPWQDFIVLFWPGHNPDRRVLSLLLAPQCVLHQSELAYKDLYYLRADAVTGSFPLAEYKVYGLR